MRYDPPAGRCAAAYSILQRARAAIRCGNDAAAQVLFRASTEALLGKQPAKPAPVDPATANSRAPARAYAQTVVNIYGATTH